MTVKGLEQVVADLPLFRGLEPRWIELLAECATNVRFEEGTTILREGQRSDRFYAIRYGQVALQVHVPQKGPRTVQTVGAGDIIGWSWLFPPMKSQFDARCLTLVRALAFDGGCLLRKCESDPKVGFEFVRRFARIMVDRLRATRLQLLDVYGDSSGG